MNAQQQASSRTRLKRIVRFIQVAFAGCVSALVAYLAADWPSPARWTMPIEYVGKNPKRQFAAANESLDEMVLHEVISPTAIRANVETGRVLGHAIEPGATYQELTIYQLSTGKVKQSFRVKRTDRIDPVVLGKDRLVVCGADNGWFLAFDRKTGEVIDQEDQPAWQRIISSPTGEQVIHWGSDFAYRKVGTGKPNWQRIVVPDSSAKPTDNPALKGELDQTATTSGTKPLNPRPFCWSPDGTFVLCARKGDQGHILSLQNVRTGKHIDGPSPALGSPHRILTRVRWLKPDQIVLDSGWMPSAPIAGPVNQSHLVTWADGDRLTVKELDGADPRFTDLAYDQWQPFADGTVVRLQQAGPNAYWPKILDLVRQMKLEQYVGKVETAVLEVSRFQGQSFSQPVARRSFPLRWVTMLQRSQFDPPPVTPQLLIQPSYLGIIEDGRLCLYQLTPLLPTWLFQLIVYLSTFAILCLLRLLWLGFRSLIRKQKKGTPHA